MTLTCELCVQLVGASEPVTRCSAEDYSPQELELMGLDGALAGAMICGRPAHTACLQQLSGARGCCPPPKVRKDVCFRHADLGSGFICLDCNRWHRPTCAAQGVVNSPDGIPQGICAECARTGRVEAAIEFLSEIPLETLELVVDALRDVDEQESEQLVRALTALRELRRVRVPHAYEPRVSPAVAIRALQRVLATARSLQSGLEREFYELLSEASLEQDFRTQQPIPIEVAARDGTGRKGVVATPDFVHRSLPYAIFLDGRTAHSSERALTDDSEISAELVLRGFLVRRFRWRQLTASFRAQTVETIRRDLAQLSADTLRKSLV